MCATARRHAERSAERFTAKIARITARSNRKENKMLIKSVILNDFSIQLVQKKNKKYQVICTMPTGEVEYFERETLEQADQDFEGAM